MLDNIQPTEDSRSLTSRLRAVLDGDADTAKARDEARAFISRMEAVPADLSVAQYREKTLGWLRDIVQAGYSRMPFDREYGGENENKKYMNIVEVIAHKDVSLAVKQGVQFGLFGKGIANLGTAKHHEKYMPDIMSGKLLGGFAMTEQGCGSDVENNRTVAVYDHATRSFVVNTPDQGARKAYIGNALHGEMMVVFAQLKMSPDGESQGVHAFLMPIRDKDGKLQPGVTVEDCGPKIGLNGVDNGYLQFDKIRLPYDALLDRFGSIDEDGNYQSKVEKKSRFFRMLGTLVTGRVFVSMISLSGAKNALVSAVNFAEKRSVFGETLLDRQATHSRLLPPLAEAYALHFVTRRLLDELQGGGREFETMAAAIKARASDSSFATVDEARKLAGGAGYMSVERYGALRNDLDICRTFEGDNTVLRLLVTKNQLGELGREFKGLSTPQKIMAPITMLFDRYKARITGARGEHLLDPSFQKNIFALREHGMLVALGRKYMKISATKGSDAANKCQDDMLAYSEAFAERLMMDRFVDKVNEQRDPEVKQVLKEVCDLFAVHALRQNALWYVQNDFMTIKKSQSLSDLEHKLCDRVRPHVKMLTEAFGIPDAALSNKRPAGLSSVPAP